MHWSDISVSLSSCRSNLISQAVITVPRWFLQYYSVINMSIYYYFITVNTHCSKHAVNMIYRNFLPLLSYLSAHSWLLQQVLLDLCPLDGSFLVKVNICVFPKPAGVVIAYGLCIAESCTRIKKKNTSAELDCNTITINPFHAERILWRLLL